MEKHYKGGCRLTEELGYQIFLLALPFFSNPVAEFCTSKKFFYTK